MLDSLNWKLYNLKKRMMLVWGLKHNYVRLYDEELIEKLRNIYFGGVPASIILLTDGLCNGYCYDRALLLSKAFLDDEDDVNLLYMSVDSLKLNPLYKNTRKDDPLYSDHCVVERTTSDGKKLIYDTSSGFIYDKNYYFFMQNPKIRAINTKDKIKEYVELEKYYHPDSIENDKYLLPMILPMIENDYQNNNEMYFIVELLQREVDIFKKKINYDEICMEVKKDINKKRVR